MADSIHKKILDAVKAVLGDADLRGIANEHIVVGVLSVENMRCLPGPPGILITPQTLEELNASDGTNVSDRVWYPVSIAIVMEYCVGKSGDAEIDKMLLWRETCRTSLSHQEQSLRDESAPSSVCDVQWIAGRVFLPGPWIGQNKWVSVFGLRVYSHEARP